MIRQNKQRKETDEDRQERACHFQAAIAPLYSSILITIKITDVLKQYHISIVKRHKTDSLYKAAHAILEEVEIRIFNMHLLAHQKKGYLSLYRSSSQLFRISLYSVLLSITTWLRQCSPDYCCHTPIF